MQTEEIAEAEGVDNEEQHEDASNDEGPSMHRDAGDIAPDTAEGHQDTAKGDQNREV
jgi:hypothetical protein